MATATPTKYHTDADKMLPRVMIRAMVALVLTVLAVVTFAVVTGRPLESTPPVSPVVAELTFTLDSDMSGAVTVTDTHGTVIAELSPEEGGFIAGVDRVIERERTNARLPAEGPVQLFAYENGRMAIHDPATGWGADLMGFGADNAAAFAKLFN